MDKYQSTATKPELIDAITNLIDEGIRKSRFGAYDEWQAAVRTLLTEREAVDPDEDDSNDPMGRTFPR